MKTELVFRLEQEPMGYGETFSTDCKINISNDSGIVYLNGDSRHPVGTFKNLRKEGEVVLADIKIFDKFDSIEHRFEYSVSGSVNKKENDECSEVDIFSVSVIMPFKD